MRNLNTVELEIVAGCGVTFRNGIVVPTTGISGRCEKLFQEILPAHFENHNPANDYNVSLTIMMNGCSSDFTRLTNNLKGMANRY